MSELDDRPKKLGELLVQAGLLPEERLSEGLDYARKHSLPLGRVLITMRLLRQEDLESVLHSQALMKLDRLPASLAVKALSMAAANHLSIDRALKKLGWFSDKYVEGEGVSIAVAREQLHNCEASFGPDHPETAASCLKLAELLTSNRQYLDAELLYNRAAQTVEACFGHQSLEMANLLLQMAEHFFAQDRFDEAEKYYWQTYEIKVTLKGERSLDVADCLEDLAELYDVQSEYLQAERLYLSSIGIKEKLLEADDPALLSSLRKLVLICRQAEHAPESRPTGELLVDAGIIVDQKKIDEGLELARKYNIPLGRALINLKQLSNEDLQRVMHAQLLMKDGCIPGYIVIRALKTSCRMNTTVQDALKLIGWKQESSADQKHLELLLRCSDELIKLEHEFGAEHPDVARKCIELADFYAGGNNLRESEILLKRALNIYLENFGEDDALTASTLSSLAQVHCRQHRFDEANHLMERAVNQSRKRQAKDSPELADYLEKQARILLASENPKDALLKMSELLNLAASLESAEGAYMSQLLELEGDISSACKQMEAALKSYKKALSIREKILIGGNPQVTGLLAKIGELELARGKQKQALPCFEKALEHSRQLFGTNHPLTAFAQLNCARTYAAMKDHKQAKTAFEEAIKVMEESESASSSDLVAVLDQYSAYLRAASLNKEADKVNKRIAELKTNSDARQTAANLKLKQ